jgi:hypothetical protein
MLYTGGGNTLHELDMPKGRLYVYDGKVTIDEHLQVTKEPIQQINNLIPIAGRVFILTQSLSQINECVVGDNGSTRTLGDTDLKNPLFSAVPTDYRVSGTKRITELFVGINEANFTHREFGIKANGTLISTLAIGEFEKTTAKTRTYIHEMGWF